MTPRHARGDDERRAQLRRIFDGDFDYVWASLRRLGIPDRDLEDLSQEVFVQVYRKIDDYDPARPIRPWLFAFMFRCASDWRRRAWRRLEVLGNALEPADTTLGAEETMARAEDLDLALGALECVDIDRRAVFILYELDGYPMKEIAASLGIPVFTGYSRLRVAREEFEAAAQRLLQVRGRQEERGQR
jgi:RNA polymerase sigma-70 factor (ECF subfamily)